MDGYSERIQIEFEEYSRSSDVMLQHTSIMSDAVLVRVQRGSSRGNVRRWNNVQKVLVCDESYIYPSVNEKRQLQAGSTHDHG